MVSIEELYNERKKRLETTVNLKVPDKVPVVIAEADFAWKYAKLSQREFFTDNDKMMMAYKKFFSDFQPDMAYFHPVLFDPLTNVINEPCIIKVPGEDIPADSVFQLVETEIMTEDDYKFAAKKGYLLTLFKLLPKLRPNISDIQNKFNEKTHELVKSRRGITENYKKYQEWGFPLWWGGGMESAFSLVCLLRSYEKFCLDMYRRRDIVKQTVEKFVSDIVYIAKGGCFATGFNRAQIGFHRESSSNFSLKIFEDIAFPQIKKTVDALSKENIITLLHCDGDWTPNLPYLVELPKGKCILDLDASTDIFKAKEILGDRMCISGNVMEILLSFGTPQKVTEHCKKLFEIVGEGGGFVLKGEASSETKPENIKAMIDATHKYGMYKA